MSELVKFKRNNGDLVRLSFDRTVQAESRFHELGSLNPHKAGEFLKAMIDASSELSEYVGTLNREIAVGDWRLAKHKAKLLVDVIPGQIEEKKLRSAEDIRKALVLLDPALEDLEMGQIDLTYVKNQCEARLEAVKAVYYSAQKLLGDSQILNRHVNGGL